MGDRADAIPETRSAWLCDVCGWTHTYDEPMTAVFCVACWNRRGDQDVRCRRVFAAAAPLLPGGGEVKVPLPWCDCVREEDPNPYMGRDDFWHCELCDRRLPPVRPDAERAPQEQSIEIHQGLTREQARVLTEKAGGPPRHAGGVLMGGARMAYGPLDDAAAIRLWEYVCDERIRAVLITEQRLPNFAEDVAAPMGGGGMTSLGDAERAPQEDEPT